MTLSNDHHQGDQQRSPEEKSPDAEVLEDGQDLAEHLAIECHGKPTYGSCTLHLLTDYFTIDKKCHRVVLSSRQISWERSKKTKLAKKSSNVNDSHQGRSTVSQTPRNGGSN